jgi:hypothetical protein
MVESNYILSLKTIENGSVEYLDGKKAVFSTQPTFTFSETDNTLHVNQVEANSFISKSDENFKDNISNLQLELDDVLKLCAKTYNYKSDDTKKKHIGFIAQEVLQIIPEVVSKDSDNNLYVNYQEVIPVLTESIKTLNAHQLELNKKLDMILEKLEP